MPRTRNISRDQWNAADTNRSSRTKENGYDSEKENEGRTTRARTRAMSRPVFGSVASTSNTITDAKGKKNTKAKGKDKPPSKGSKTKTEKLPLQDITKRFLPAPEPENRGRSQEGSVFAPVPAGIHASIGPASITQSTDNPFVDEPVGAGIPSNRFPSSLPPSSPPSVSSSVNRFLTIHSDLPMLPAPSIVHASVADRTLSMLDDFDLNGNEQVYDQWDEFDGVVEDSEGCERDTQTPGNSDPFGFFALERKLKAEREMGREEELEAGGLILVADTSSPRPVPRLPHRQLGYLDETRGHRKRDHDQLEADGEEADISHIPSMPPTPHKEKGKGRLSYDGSGEHVFSPHSSSLPSTPSPSKPTSTSVKRREVIHQPECQENEAEILNGKVEGKKRAKLEMDAEKEPLRRQLRSRRTQHDRSECAEDGDYGRKVKGRILRVKRDLEAAKRKPGIGKSKSKKPISKIVEDSDDEKWEQERQARLEYFQRVKDYKVEEENVYVI